MALIEGVGDEVTVLFALVFLFTVIALAWISTHTSERPSDEQDSSEDAPVGEQRADAPSPEPSLTDSEPQISDDSTLSSTLSSFAVPAANDTSDLAERLTTQESPPESSEGPDSAEASGGPSGSESPTLRFRGPKAQTEDHPAEAGDTISIRLKFLNDTERVVTLRLSDTVLHIKRSQFPGQEARIRLIYQGQLLRDDAQTLSSLQLNDGCVLHCHISQHASPPGYGSAELPEIPLNVGSLLVPLLVLILALLWYCQFQYPHLFTGTATVCLGAITLLVVVIALATYRR
ncbi:transmembrane and ubiquitin-like domain-containing protein 1 [Hyperolius riggenbachi]|uniref:transmembrane and ubiquitin-like domain-containing protein 1 n=1 Tax=Hyperolius riggenbachi TaxID=752182 RepID=UPI0035A2F809